MYSLPERKEFYPEVRKLLATHAEVVKPFVERNFSSSLFQVVNMLEGSDLACTVLFSQFDLLRVILFPLTSVVASFSVYYVNIFTVRWKFRLA